MSRAEDPRFEPDVRFLLANERTLLAWIRTAVGVIAGGVLIAHLGTRITLGQRLLAMGIIITGATMAMVGYVRFRAADTAIREGRLPSTGKAPRVEAVALVIIAVALLIIVGLNNS